MCQDDAREPLCCGQLWLPLSFRDLALSRDTGEAKGSVPILLRDHFISSLPSQPFDPALLHSWEQIYHILKVTYELIVLFKRGGKNPVASFCWKLSEVQQ